MQEDSDVYENIPFTSGQGHNSWFRSEIARLKFDVRGAWRTSLANKEHKLCPTYPPEILVPAFISDAELEKCASFRSAKRLPAVVWRHTENGKSILPLDIMLLFHKEIPNILLLSIVSTLQVP